MKTLKNITIAWFCTLSLTAVAQDRNAAEIINSYVEDYRLDQFASEAMYFGIEVPDNGMWNVKVTGTKTKEGWEVVLADGLPETPTFVYRIELETFGMEENS